MSLSVLRAMQLADSGFPTGGFAFSWGLESAVADGQLDLRSLADWVAVELRSRWHRGDRVALAGGHRYEGAALTRWFDTVDGLMPVDRLRSDSLDAGDALFAAARALRIPMDPGACAAQAAGVGHFAVAHGSFLRRCGLDLLSALAASAFGMARGAFSAAVRLGLAGAISTQRDLLALAPLMAELATAPAPDDLPSGFMPLSDVALMRPRDGRLFIN
ncbi:urease accessory protein UreF [Salipiger marinus]|uniref:urease accessory protein UreF n=1 Tax=Salipiger marinus TaxID=555512 RepID=UPI002C0B782C|nr:urease accessory UreF family protein [Salipiger manganoxidans]MEB3419181.1 urease accessory UreF family protein [Salipiger manganoxidans]